MATVEKGKPNNFQVRKILWASFRILDLQLHSSAELEILGNLEKRGYKNSLLAVFSKNRIRSEKPQYSITSIPLRYVPIITPFIFSLFMFFFLPFYIIVSKPDIIITQPDVSILGFTSAFLFSKFKRVKLVLDVRSTPVETSGSRGRLRTFFFTVSILIARKFFNGMTIITHLMKEEVCKKFKINPKFVGVWSGGVSTTIFNPGNHVSEGEKLKRKLGLSKKFIVFYHGVFSENRGLTETIHAMGIVKDKFPDVIFFLLGNGPIVNNLEDLIQMRGLQDNVVIHNSVEHTNVPKYITMSDVGIVPLQDHPYWRFQCPFKLLEYLAMEKPVIATDIPAHLSIMGEQKCGIYLSSTKPIEIAKAIEYAYLNRDSLKERGKIGRDIVKREYTWEKVAENLENYLLSIYELRKK